MARGSTSNPTQNAQPAAAPQTQSNNPKDNNDKPKETPEPQEETKQNAKKMGWKDIGGRLLKLASSDFGYKGPEGGHFNLLGLFSRKESNESEETAKKTKLTPKELLGMIYKAMVKLDTYRKLQYQETKNHLQEQNQDKNRKHKQIIKALMGLVPKKSEEEPKEKANTANIPASTSGTPGTPPVKPPILPIPGGRLPGQSHQETNTAPVASPKNANASQQTTAQIEKTQTAEPVSYTAATVTSGFGSRLDPYNSNRTENHQGVDLRAPVGTKVYSKGPGTVSEVNESPENGKFIKIQYDDGRNGEYLHLSDTSVVKKGDKVGAGTLIAKTGNTGHSKYPHLHFGVRDSQGKSIQPSKEEMEYTLNPPEVVNKRKEEQKSPPKKEAVDNNSVNPKNASPVSPTTASVDNSASKVPELMPDGKVQLQDNDFGYSGFLAKAFSKVDPNKLQRDYKGNWYYEDGTLVTDQKKKNSAERRWIFNTYGLLAGTKIDAKELKTIGLTGEAIKNTDGLWYIINDNKETIVKDKETINKLEKIGKSKFVASLENNIGDTVDTLSFENKNYKQDLIASSSETTNNQNVIIMKKNNINMNNEKVDDNNPYTQKLG